MGLWTRVRLPPAPFIVVRRDPAKPGGFLAKHADARERSSHFNASDPITALHVAKAMCSAVIFVLEI